MKLLKVKIKWMQWLGVFILAFAPVFTQAQINLTIADSSLQAGTTINLPIYVDQINATDGVIAGEFQFSFNDNIIDVIGFEKTGTLLESVSSVMYFEGTDKLAFAATDTVVGNGILVYLKVKANNNASYYQQSSLNFVKAVFNEGNPSSTTTNGNIQIEGVTINPKSNIRITKGDSLQFELTGFVNNPITWESSDTSLATIDTNGMFVAKKLGLVTVKATESGGLSDVTQFINILPQSFSDLTVTIPDSNTTQTLTIDLPIQVSDITGLEVLSLELDVNFNASHLSLQEVTPGDITSKWGNPTLNIDNNRVQIAAAGTDTLEGAGTLYNLRFKVISPNATYTDINLTKSAFNEDLSATNESSRLYINSAPNIQITPADTALSIGKTMPFSVDIGDGTAPINWTSSDPSIATIDASTGELTGVARGDVRIRAFDADNFSSNSANIRINDFDAYLDSALLVYGDTVTVSLFTEDLTIYSISSYETEFSFDSTKLDFVGIDLDGTQTQTAGLSVEVRDTSDVIKIAAAGTNFLSGKNSILNFKFTAKEPVIDGENLTVNLMSLSFNEPSPAVPTVTKISGEITIQRIDPPSTPALISPNHESTNVDTTVLFSWTNISTADSYSFQLSKTTTFDSLITDSVTTLSELNSSNLDFETSYYWRVKAKNVGGESAWSSVYSFTTIIDKPETPVLLLPDNGDEMVDTLAQFVWNTADRATDYTFQLSKTGDFATVISDKSLTDTTTSIGNLSFLTEYFWRVKATNTGGESDWSLVSKFTVKAQDASIPTLISPTNTATNVDTSLALLWNKAEGALSYQVQLSELTDFSSTQIDTDNLTDTTYSVVGLSHSKSYHWRVRAFGAADTSAWSSVYSFSTKSKLGELGVPELISPKDDSLNLPTTLLFTWNSVEDASDYFVELITDSSTTNVEFERATKDTTIRIDSLMFATQYFWRVKAVDSLTSRQSNWSDYRSFTVMTKNSVPEFVNLPDTISFFENESFEFKYGDFIEDVEDEIKDLSIEISVDESLLNIEIDTAITMLTISSKGFIGDTKIGIKVTDTNGDFIEDSVIVSVSMSTSNENENNIPTNFTLSQNYPNPFNPSSTIKFGIPEAAVVKLEIYNLLGQKVKSLVNEKKSVGFHAVTFDASNLTSGMYIYRIQAGSFVQIKKMTLIK